MDPQEVWCPNLACPARGHTGRVNICWGCPLVAIEHAFGLQPQTIRDWLEVAGQHVEAVHHKLVTQTRDLGHVQADEVRVKTQCGIVWMAMTMMVFTLLWLGGAVSTRHYQHLIRLRVRVIFAALPSRLIQIGLAFPNARDKI